MPTTRDYNDALLLPSAHRFPEVAGAFAKATVLVAEEAAALGKSSRWVGCHPLARLYLEQLMLLSNNGPGPHHTWRTALGFAQKAALGKEASAEIGGHHYRFTPEVAGNGRS
ncbi:MAG: hypothetical protein ACREXX_16425 [Gammaproteobacteria bacterium]